MRNMQQNPALFSAVAIKLRGRRGQTLVELMTVLLLISFFSLIALAVMGYATNSERLIVNRSRARTVSDTINETLRGILRYSTYIRTETETVYFLCESYSGWELSLEAVEGFILMYFCDGSENRREKILSDPSYAGFWVDGFKLEFEDGTYKVKYRLTNGTYYEDFELSINEKFFGVF